MIKSEFRSCFIPRTLATCLLLATPTLGMAMSPLRLDFDGEAVVVRDLEPGAEVVYFSVSRSVKAFVPRTERRADRHLDEDNDGEVRISLDQAIPAKFFAVAVELSSGRFAVLTPQGSPAREIAFPADSFGQGPGRRFDRLEDRGDYEELLLVRAGLGAWTLTTGDGAATDESPSSDGMVRTSVSSMQPVGDSGPPPDEYESDDLLVRIAPRAGMEYYTARIVR